MTIPGMIQDHKLRKRQQRVRKKVDFGKLQTLRNQKVLNERQLVREKMDGRKVDDADYEAEALFREEVAIQSEELPARTDIEAVPRFRFKHVAEDDEEDGHARLPLKVDGKLIPQAPHPKQESERDEDMVADEGYESPQGPETFLQKAQKRREFVEQAKIQIALYCQKLVADPEGNYKCLFPLVGMIKKPEIQKSVLLTKLLLLSLAEVFKDIVPGYKIRELTAEEKKVRVKKETKKRQDFEAALLENYQVYLKRLEALFQIKPQNYKNFKDRRAQRLMFRNIDSLKATGAKCLSVLLVNLPHFNFRTNLVKMVATVATSRIAEVSEIMSRGLCEAFANDRHAELSVEIMYYMDKILVSKDFEVHSCCLKSFLKMPIRNVDLKKVQEYHDRKDKGDRKNKKGPRLDRSTVDVVGKKRKLASLYEEKWLTELQELETKIDDARLNFLHGKIISFMFAIYFRVLKRDENSANLSVILEGVAKYGHCIGVEFYDDLLALMRNLLKRDDLSYSQRLHCVLTVFRLLTGDGDVLTIDVGQFYAYLYESLVALAEVDEGEFALTVQTVREGIARLRRDHHSSRSHAFCKRLATLLLHTNTLRAFRIANTLSATLHGRSDQLLSEETVGSGKYNPYVNDPDFCSAQNTALWELSLLRRHYDAALHPVATSLSGLKPVNQTHTPLALEAVVHRMPDRLPNVHGVKRGILRDPSLLIKAADANEEPETKKAKNLDSHEDAKS